MSTHTQMWIDRTRNALAFFLIGSFVGAVIALTFFEIPKANNQLLTYMLGQLSGMALLVLGYYFTKGAGQDNLDAARTENTGKMADAITATAKRGSGGALGVEQAVDNVADAAVDAAAAEKGERP